MHYTGGLWSSSGYKLVGGWLGDQDVLIDTNSRLAGRGRFASGDLSPFTGIGVNTFIAVWDLIFKSRQDIVQVGQKFANGPIFGDFMF